jgi:hypothetical protein
MTLRHHPSSHPVEVPPGDDSLKLVMADRVMAA